MTSLFDKYHPQTLDEVIGQPAVLKRLRFLESRGGWGGRAFFLSGVAGSGKTAIAGLLVNAVCEDYAITREDAQKVNASFLDDAEAKMRYRPLSLDKPFRGYVINEAHGLDKAIVSRLLTVLDPQDNPGMRHTIWVFTTTLAGFRKLADKAADFAPLLSRCIDLELTMTPKQMQVYAARLHEIARLEGLDGRPAEDYLEALKERRGNLRAALQDLESGGLL